jgi:MerR family mercuric resistance operon transcriptional regulator
MNGLTIGKLAERGGVNLQTIRYYERLGLLPKPPRSQSGYRQFPEAAPRRVRFIKRAQELGFSLKEIKELLALRVEPGKTRADVRQRAEAKIADIEGKIKSLRKMRKSLAEITKVCCGDGPVSDCPILESLNHEEQ